MICFPRHLTLHLYVINLLKLKVTIMSMKSILYRILKIIMGQVAVVFIFNSELNLLDMMSLSRCYLNKLMIVNNYSCFYHQMFGLNSPKRKLVINSKLGILLEMLIYINDIFIFSLKGRLLFGEGCSVTATVTPYATLVSTE